MGRIVKRKFTKEVKTCMYGFGDVPDPLPESVDLMDELLEWFIIDLCETAQSRTQGKLKTIDFLNALQNDPKKLARAHELLKMDKDLRMSRALFDVQELAGVHVKDDNA